MSEDLPQIPEEMHHVQQRALEASRDLLIPDHVAAAEATATEQSMSERFVNLRKAMVEIGLADNADPRGFQVKAQDTLSKLGHIYGPGGRSSSLHDTGYVDGYMKSLGKDRRLYLPNVMGATNYLSYEDQQSPDPESGLVIGGHEFKMDQMSRIYHNKDAVVPIIGFADSENGGPLETMSTWASQFLSPEQVEKILTSIKAQQEHLAQNKGKGSFHLYHVSRPRVVLREVNGEVRASIGADMLKNYDGQMTSVGFYGVEVPASTEMLADIEGATARKIQKMQTLESLGKRPTIEEVSAEAHKLVRSFQESELQAFEQTTPEYQALSKQDLLNAGILLPLEGETVEELPNDEKLRIKKIVHDVQKLNNDIKHAA